MVVAVVVVVMAAVVLPAAAIPLEVETQYGRIRGVKRDDVTAFYGIPFAAPPVDELRFAPPQEPKPWSGTKDCTQDKYFHICPQFHVVKNIFLGQEDCLYANIYVPDVPESEYPLPVMFWIYGGGFTIGDGYEFGWYRAVHLAAKRRAIVVEFNYRLGLLGFLALPALKAEHGTTGNYGTQDQSLALDFVHRNIAKFGGDSKRVTIFGESAGAMSVCWHLVSEHDAGKFSGAIMESGTCESAEFFVTEQRGFRFSKILSQFAGCNYTDPDQLVACMRARPVGDLLVGAANAKFPADGPPLGSAFPVAPVIDNSTRGLLERPGDLIAQGRFNKVPLIMGTNLNEGSVFLLEVPRVISGAYLPLNDKGIELALHHFFNDTTTKGILQQYPKENYRDDDQRLAMIIRDFVFTCNTKKTLRRLSDQGLPAWMYQFTPKLTNWPDYLALGDYHSLELSFTLDHPWPPVIHEFGPAEQRLSDAMTLYWTNIPKYGRPDGQLEHNFPHWPAFNASQSGQYMDFNLITPTVSSNLNDANCKFWDVHYPKYYFEQ